MKTAQITYDPITKDLARKCADDVGAAMGRTMLLGDNLESQAAIALMAAGTANAVAAAVMAALIEADDAEVVADALWAAMRPQLISAIAMTHKTPL